MTILLTVVNIKLLLVAGECKLVSDYSTWSLEKLKKESARIEKVIKEKESQEKKMAVAEIKALAKKHGFALADLLQESAGKPKTSSKLSKTNGGRRKSTTATNGKAAKTVQRAKAKIKYRNPHNDSETWTGRGRQPRWVAFHVTNGGSLDDLTI